MTLEEAIRHCEEVAEQNEQGLYDAIALGGQNPTQEEIANCEQCAADHRQLAEWLTELKEWKENPFLQIRTECRKNYYCNNCAFINHCPFSNGNRVAAEYPMDWVVY